MLKYDCCSALVSRRARSVTAVTSAGRGPSVSVTYWLARGPLFRSQLTVKHGARAVQSAREFDSKE